MQHRRRSFQQIHLVVCCLFSIWTFDFSLVDRYPELRGLEIRQLARTLLSSNPDPTLESLKKKINFYTHGQLPRGKPIITVLYEPLRAYGRKFVRRGDTPPCGCAPQPGCPQRRLDRSQESTYRFSDQRHIPRFPILCSSIKVVHRYTKYSPCVFL